jgi:hypothetical protein
MATAQETINRALRMTGVLADGQTATASQSADALNALNEMLYAWRDRGVDLGHSALGLGDEIPYQDDHLACIRYSLAVEISGDFGRPASQDIQYRQQQLFLALQAQYCNPPMMSTDYPVSGCVVEF